jgi:hypothetical protein
MHTRLSREIGADHAENIHGFQADAFSPHRNQSSIQLRVDPYPIVPEAQAQPMRLVEQLRFDVGCMCRD